jgi:predicted dehydrogenase
MADVGINVALVGLGFGAEFVPIYQAHPAVRQVAICDADQTVLSQMATRYDVEHRYTSLTQVLEDPAWDAVHLVTPIPLHARQAIAVLQAGKHCACTVPMATSVEDVQAIVAAQRASGKHYMMMETAVYTREFLFAQQMLRSGQLGKMQFLRGAHYQDMEGWPAYWAGLPPMHYATHAVAPLLALAQTRASVVHCFGSGSMRPELREHYSNPFPIETAILRLERTELAAEVTRSLYETAKAYTESFTVYGEHMTFEWQQIEEEQPVVYTLAPLENQRGRPVQATRVHVPDRQDLLPPEIARFTQRGVYDPAHPHRSFLQGGGHGGSHPHLVHEFVTSIVEDRPPAIDAVRAADWTLVGICAHQSALVGGAAVAVPTVG